MEVGFNVDWAASMPAIRVPTLVLHRAGDIAVAAAQGREVAESIAGASYVELPGIDHLPWVGDQDAIVREVRAFVEGLAPTPSRDRILTTILVTDIVGSTETAVRLGDRAWRGLLGDHRRQVRHELDAVGGREIDTAATGSSRRSRYPRTASGAPARSSTGRRRSGSTSAPGCTPASAS